MTNKEYGIKALNLEMTDSVHRMEYSVLGHSQLVRKVTGLEPNTKEAMLAFHRAWDMCANWNIMVDKTFLGNFRTSMGHAEYAENGADRDDNIFTCFDSEDDVFAFDPFEKLPFYEEDKLVQMFNDNYDSQVAWNDEVVSMTGTYITCMSGLIDLLGWEMLLACAGYDIKKFGELTDRYNLWMERFYKALAKSKTPVVMVHDDIVWTEGAFLHPDFYRKHIFPAYKKNFDYLKEAGKKILFTSDGTFTEFLDDIVNCGADTFFMEPTTDMAYFAEKYGNRCGFVGNADTRVLLLGSKDDIYNEVKRCMDIGKRYPGFIMAVGNHIPPNTPVDSCLWYDDFCKKLGKR